MLRLIGLSTLAFSFYCLGCGGSVDSSFNFIPNIEMKCDHGQAAACEVPNTGYMVFAGVKEVTSQPCEDIMFGADESQLKQIFTVTTLVPSSRSGDFLIATGEGWTNSNNSRIHMLDAGQYRVCAFIDADANGVLSSGDAVGTGKITVGVSGARMTNWKAAQ